MTDVRTLLHDLAAEAPRGHGEDTADRVVEVHRAQDRRRLRLAGVVAAVAVVVAVAPGALGSLRSPDSAATAVASGDAVVESLFDVPTRGSLADDDALLDQALRASWDDGISYDAAGDILDPVRSDRRVVFAGEVPGGQIWTLVMGRTGTQLAYAWFVDVDPADGIDLQLAGSPLRTVAGSPIALVDVAGASGPLAVVAMPEEETTFVRFGADGAPPDILSEESAGGVTVAVVATPEGAGTPGYQLVRDDVVQSTYRPEAFDSGQPLGPLLFYAPAALGASTDAVSAPLVVECMTSAGWPVTADAAGTLSYADPLSIVDLASFDAALSSCLAQVAAGDPGD